MKPAPRDEHSVRVKRVIAILSCECVCSSWVVVISLYVFSKGLVSTQELKISPDTLALLALEPDAPPPPPQ